MKWKPSDPPNLAWWLLNDRQRFDGARCQFCGQRGAEEWWKEGPAHTRCLDTDPTEASEDD